MKFSLAAALAFVASAVAQTADFDPITKPDSGATFAVGSTLTIAWTAPAKYSGKTIAISLIGGETQNTQVPLLDIASGVSNDALTYSWVVPASVAGKNFYGFVFKLESDTSIFQYSNPFHISGAVSSSAVVSTSAAPVTSTAASSTGVVTISLSSKPADYTTVVPVYETTTVPCNTTTVAPYVPPVVTAPTVKPYSNATFTTAVVPPVKTTGGNSGSTAVPTPVVTGAGARFAAGPIAVFGGLLVAAFAL